MWACADFRCTHAFSKILPDASTAAAPSRSRNCAAAQGARVRLIGLQKYHGLDQIDRLLSEVPVESRWLMEGATTP